jgi:UDP-N-acetyl-D-galactosamine dehydrogenase
MNISKVRVCVIGLGYVGLPLAVEFSKKITVIGFDINTKRIEELNRNEDHTNELTSSELKSAGSISFTSIESDISDCNCYIVTVPTPIDANKKPDLMPLIEASELVGRNLDRGDTIIYESTVFPGATEEVCVPILEKHSKLNFNSDFFVGYSPERINPGDKEHRLPDIKKIVSGSNLDVLDFVDSLYGLIIVAGTHRAESIKVAESAKVIENTQRDLNIALINELSIIFDHLNIDTESVLKAAETKWNFFSFRPGLVGGHCIGVDPYYLTHKVQEIGYEPEIILAGRRLNDSMSKIVASKIFKQMDKKQSKNILIMGLSFKENCPDIRNTKVVDIYTELQGLGCQVSIFDPWVDKEIAWNEYAITMIDYPEEKQYDGIILAVGHNDFKEMGVEKIRKFGADSHILFDLKYIFDQSEVDLRL